MDTPSDVPIPAAADPEPDSLPANVISFKRPTAADRSPTRSDEEDKEIRSVDDLLASIAEIKSSIESASVVFETHDGRTLFMFSPQTSMQMVFKSFAMQIEVASMVQQGNNDDD